MNNLKILCPNCHSQTNNYSGKKIKEKKEKKENKKYCECGKEIKKTSKYCLICKSKNSRKVERPNKAILLEEIKNLGYVATGKKYGVSDNAVRKWIK